MLAALGTELGDFDEPVQIDRYAGGVLLVRGLRELTWIRKALSTSE